MSMTMELEDLALGEVTLADGAATVAAALKTIDHDEAANELYDALRSWLWKTLEARRRDDELEGWMDLFSRAAARIGDVSQELATKLEGFMELLHASIMTADHHDPFTRKHVADAARHIQRTGGRIRRGDLMELLTLKGPNLSRVMTPLIDAGLIAREVDGREIFYRLTMRGMAAAPAHRDRAVFTWEDIVVADTAEVNPPATYFRVDTWHEQVDPYVFHGGGYSFTHEKLAA